MTKRLGCSVDHTTVCTITHAGSVLKAKILSLEAYVSRLMQELADAKGAWPGANIDLQDAEAQCQLAADPCEYLGSTRLVCFKCETICCLMHERYKFHLFLSAM